LKGKDSIYKNTIRETQHIDTNTGEIIGEITVSNYKAEPSFVKLYLQDIELLSGISNNGILGEFLKHMDYTNQIVVNSYIKRQVAERSGNTVKNVEKQMALYIKKHIWQRVDRGTYIFNAYLFGKGKWADVLKIRTVIDYEPQGRTITTNITRKDSKSKAIAKQGFEIVIAESSKRSKKVRV
jgi:hypothetical protein